MIANQFVSRMNGLQRNQTLITFNNGARWQKIQAPAIVNGAPSNCTLVRLILIAAQYDFYSIPCYNLIRLSQGCSIYAGW